MSEKQVDWSARVEVRKTKPEGLILGWLSVVKTKDGSYVRDLQNDIVPMDEVTKAAQNFFAAGQADENHDEVSIARPVYSVVTDADVQKAMGIPTGYTHEGWFIGLKTDPESAVFKRVTTGERRGFSIGGKAFRVPVDIVAKNAGLTAIRKSVAAEAKRDTVNVLRDLRVNFASIVDEGANQYAEITLWKRNDKAGDPMKKAAPTCEHGTKVGEDCAECGGKAKISKAAQGGEEGTMKIDKSKLAPEVVAYIDGVEKANADLTTEVTTLKARTPAADPNDFDTILKSVEPGVAAVLKSLKDRADGTETTLKKERDDRAVEAFITKAKAMPFITKAPSEFGLVLKDVSDHCAPTTLAAIEKALADADRALEDSDLFKEIGGAQNAGDGSAYAALVAKADEIRKATPTMTEQQAIAKAAEQNPELYKQYEAEKN